MEEAVYDSGMDFTVLQPAMFMQMLDGAWQSAQQLGRIAMPYSKHAKACYVDYRDVAEAAALALTGDALSRGTFELSAPGMVNRVELAAFMSRVLGRAVVAEEPSFADWAQQAELPPGPVRDGLERMRRLRRPRLPRWQRSGAARGPGSGAAHAARVHRRVGAALSNRS